MTKRNAIAREVAGYDQARQPGDFYFIRHKDERVGIIHTCPCGCGHFGSLYWKNPRTGGANWTVKGEWPRVTLDPSIGFNVGTKDAPKGADGYHWHGYLRDGMFTEL